MPQILFVVDIPTPGLSTEDIDAPTRWFSFADNAKSIPLPIGSQKLSCKNVWLFPGENSEQARRALANCADEYQLAHSTFLVSGDISKL